jgi:hypothetical protein
LINAFYLVLSLINHFNRENKPRRATIRRETIEKIHSVKIVFVDFQVKPLNPTVDGDTHLMNSARQELLRWQAGVY